MTSPSGHRLRAFSFFSPPLLVFSKPSSLFFFLLEKKEQNITKILIAKLLLYILPLGVLPKGKQLCATASLWRKFAAKFVVRLLIPVLPTLAQNYLPLRFGETWPHFSI